LGNHYHLLLETPKPNLVLELELKAKSSNSANQAELRRNWRRDQPWRSARNLQETDRRAINRAKNSIDIADTLGLKINSIGPNSSKHLCVLCVLCG